MFSSAVMIASILGSHAAAQPNQNSPPASIRGRRPSGPAFTLFFSIVLHCEKP